MATLHSIPGDAVAWREVDGEFVLISVETTHYYSLNSSGSDIWRILLEGPQTAESIASVLATRHGLESGAIGGAVLLLLDELRGEGLLRLEEDGDAAPALAALAAAPRGVAVDGNGGYQPPSLLKYEALERLILSGE